MPSSSIRAYVIWLPALPSDTRQDATLASGEFSDSRVNYFWDPETIVADPFGKKLGLSGFAWDVYMLYDRGEKWKKETLSEPKFWMHQLMGAENLAPALDSVVLRWQTETLVKRLSAK